MCEVPRTRTTLGDRSFAVAGPRLWGNLPCRSTYQVPIYLAENQNLRDSGVPPDAENAPVLLRIAAPGDYSFRAPSLINRHLHLITF